jgi:hypothetical protein
MRRLGATYSNPQDGSSLFTLALASAAVIAAIELPISQYYSTTPESKTPTRMVIAGAMAFVAVLVAGAALKFNKQE